MFLTANGDHTPLIKEIFFYPDDEPHASCRSEEVSYSSVHASLASSHIASHSCAARILQK